jgi:hypothetical protein
VEVLGLSIAFINETQVECRLRLSVRNPERTAGSVTRLSWELWVQRRGFAEGEQSLDQTLQPASATQFELALPIALRRAPASPGTVEVETLVRGQLAANLGGSEQQLFFERRLRAKAPASPLWEVGVDEE